MNITSLVSVCLPSNLNPDTNELEEEKKRRNKLFSEENLH
jgi:hypothetical protein